LKGKNNLFYIGLHVVRSTQHEVQVELHHTCKMRFYLWGYQGFLQTQSLLRDLLFCIICAVFLFL